MQGADLKKQFGKRLKFIREIENLTQAGLAAAVGVTEQYLSMLERGLSSPSFDVISRLCTCLGVDPAGLFLFNEVAPPDGAGDEPLRQDWGSHLTRVGLLDVDLPDGPGHWSASLRELLGLPRSAPDPGLEGLEAMVPPEDRAAFRRDWALLISGAAAPCLECRLVRHDGVERWVLGQGECECDPSGVPVRARLCLVDITERRRMEERVRESLVALERRVCERTGTLSRAVRRLEAEVVVRREAEQALGRTTRALRALLDATDDGAALYDSAGVVLAANATSARDWGVPPDQVAGLTLEQRLGPAGAREAAEAFRRCRDTGRPVTFPFRLGERYLETRIYPIPSGPDGGAGWADGGFAVYARDVTELRCSETRLREREAQLAAIFRSVPVGIGLVDRERTIRMVNDRLCAMLGRDHAGLEGQSARILYPSDEEYERIGFLKRAEERGRGAGVVETRFQAADGHPVDVLFSFALPAQHDAPGVVFTAMDITDRLRAERALRESEERFRTVAEFSRDWDYWVGPEGELRYMSPSCETITGYPPQAFQDDPGLLVAVVHPKDREHFAAHAALEHLNGAPCSMEFRILTKGGEERWLQHECQPVSGQDGEHLGRRVSNRDATQRKRLDAMREDVERVIRHDLRAPATSVIGACRALRDDGLDEDQDELVGLLEESAERMLDLLDMTLDIFRMETGAYALRPERVDLTELAHRVFREAQAAVRPGPAGYRLVRNGAGRTPEDGDGASFAVWGEPRLLHSLLANLVLNAAQASPEEGEVTVRLGRDGDADLVSVCNQGAVPAPMRERFFEKYATYGKRTGIGLGTYSARLVTELHGGQIRMRTSDSEGTRVDVRLPRSGPGPAEC